MSLLEEEDFRRLCEDGDGDTDVRGESGERVRMILGGVIHDVKASERRSGSNGEEDGEEKGLSLRLCVIGKVKARGVGEMMARVGGCGASVVTSSARGKVSTTAA